jgi:hypothetical protein
VICVSGERRRPWSRQDGDRRAGEGERVGGLGSGRRRTGLGVDECRTLEVGELCDRGRWLTQPRGEVLWRSMQGGETRGRLTYVISRRGGDTGELRLTYRYAHQGANLSFEHEVELDCSPGKRSYLSCPRCGARVRTLYAPLGAEFFACRSCYGLVYRRSGADDTLAYLAEVAGPAMRELRALPKRTRRQPRRRYVRRSRLRARVSCASGAYACVLPASPTARSPRWWTLPRAAWRATAPTVAQPSTSRP